MPDNPFSAPSFDGGGASVEGTVRVEGELLIMGVEGPSLPDRCVKCNEYADHRFSKKLQWIPKWVPFTILICWPVYLGAFFMFRKTAMVDVGLCDAHHSRHKQFMMLGGGGLFVGIALMVLGLFAEYLIVAALGFVGLIAGVLLMIPARVVWPTFIDEHEGTYKGACQEFLDSL